jgi:flagellar motor switch protein FliM
MSISKVFWCNNPMQQDITIIAARKLAQHCPELLRQGPSAAELIPQLDRVLQKYLRLLPSALAPLLGGQFPQVTAEKPQRITYGKWSGSVAPLAANSLMTLSDAASFSQQLLLLTLPAEPLLRMVDRAFGGKGDVPNPLPEVLPMAADMMIPRIDRLMTDQLILALRAVNPDAHAPQFAALRRDGSLSQLAPFPADTELLIIALSVNEDRQAPWSLQLVLPLCALPLLFGISDDDQHPQPAPNMRRIASANDAPFADIPLPLSAVLVDMLMPFGTVARLSVGQIIPVAVARSVPIRAAGQTIAHGSVGAVDDRVAIQITQAFADRRNPTA